MPLFPRLVEVAAGDSVISGDFTERGGGPPVETVTFRTLMIQWAIERTTDSRSASGVVSLYNLKPETEAKLADRYSALRLSAGYPDRFGLLLNGTIRDVQRQQAGLERVAHVDVGGQIDEVAATVNGIVDVSYEGEVGLETVIADVTAQLGLPVEDLSHVAGLGVMLTDYSSGLMSARRLLTDLLNPYGMAWYEDNGVIRFRLDGMAGVSKGGVLLVSERTGMIGTPGIIEDGLRLRTLIDHRIELDGVVRVESAFHGREVAGSWKVIRIRNYGDSREGEAATEFDVRAL